MGEKSTDLERHAPERFSELPAPVRIEDTVAAKGETAPDPNMGLGPERDFMLRYAAL